MGVIIAQIHLLFGPVAFEVAGLFCAPLTNGKIVHIFAARSKLTKMDKIKIGEAAELYGLEKRTFQKRLKTALDSPKKRDIFARFFPEKAPENVGLGDPFTDELRGFWEMWTDGKTDALPKTDLAKTKKRTPKGPKKNQFTGPVLTEVPENLAPFGWVKHEVQGDDPAGVKAFYMPAKGNELNEDYEKFLYNRMLAGFSDNKEDYQAPNTVNSAPLNCDPPQLPDLPFSDVPGSPKPDVPEMPEPPISKPEPKPDAQKVDVIETFFGSKKIVLCALTVLIFSDGFSMSILAGRTFPDNPLAYFLFSIVGVIIGYAAISTARASSFATTRMWESSNAGWWITLFSVFQTALHGAAFELFSELEKLTTNEIIGRVLICISISLATASLTSIILKR